MGTKAVRNLRIMLKDKYEGIPISLQVRRYLFIRNCFVHRDYSSDATRIEW